MAFFKRAKSSHDRKGPTTSAFSRDPVEQLTQEIGREFLEQARSHQRGLLSSRFWSDKLMDWAMKDEAFKVQLFRFVDVFPMLKTPEAVHETLVDYLSQPGVNPPAGLDLGMRAGGLLKGAFASTVTSQIESMAGKFIAGRDPSDALPRLHELWKKGIAFSVDLLGEASLSDAEAAVDQRRYLDLIEQLPREVAAWEANPVLDSDHLGPIPRTNVSIKISALYARTKPADFEGSIAGLIEAIGPILKSAKQHNVFINFDMEQHALKDLTVALFERCCEQFDFEAGLAMQAYLRSGEQDARRIVEWAQRYGKQVTVRLIKGAYWDYETIHSEMMNWPSPVWEKKSETDACFERMTKLFIDQIPTSRDAAGVKLALGSHNIRSIAHALALLKQRDLPENAIELQMLHGMADELKEAAVERGLRLREYVPVGEMIPGMAYLVRRLLENTSNESWLRAGFLDRASPERLLAPPHREGEAPAEPSSGNGQQTARHEPRPLIFVNEPLRDFSDGAQREVFAQAIKSARVPEVANAATTQATSDAVALASGYFRKWREMDVRERAELIRRAASIMRARRDELSGIIIKESGKTWSEADADVCEAIDFCEYYARMAVEIQTPRRLGNFVGELNLEWYEPRGVAVVISPWNFPLSICTGMTTAALVSGNATIVKPAEQTPGIARAMAEILWEAGVPREALQFLAGQGETVGAALVRDPRVALIAFTGSKAVGLDIIEAAGHTPEGQPFVKKVISEMGGKNAIIVDASADLDEAVLGVRQSAFSFSGQKCSACSRAIVLDSIYDTFVRRLVEATRCLQFGNPLDPWTDIGPVIDDGAARKIESYIEIGKREATVALATEAPTGLPALLGKPYIGPHIFTNVEPDDRLAQEEIFGPVLSVIRARDFEEALNIANGTSYKLTGGVFSRTPAHLAKAQREFRVGNLYLNRGITGALVGRQPFGGFGLSGVGSKAGGRDYLLQFVEPRVCTENTMRRGFAPTTGEAGPVEGTGE
jgi:RHH-type proline utilization regulon transcriptional repressor/proline dehydrogenase/delta 1-pyrroline-5-carboxylate dehydrogenase